ncbi:MAG: DUF2442 domain-containing protein [Prevotellaceae bacterium]|jgi:hypothetical protein|nr:DUF2442 domain-containing protein [Prevotellaceae bacterium]
MEVVRKLWFSNDRIFIQTAEGRVQSQHLRFFPRLRNSSDSQRAEWSESHFGIHWDKIDEDISFESFTWPDNDPCALYHGS